jgi:hypothetical protein
MFEVITFIAGAVVVADFVIPMVMDTVSGLF